jgi:hypothetical protein
MSEIELFLDENPNISDNSADIFLFLHDGSSKLRDSRDLLFFGQDSVAGGAVRLLNTAHKQAVYIDPAKLPKMFTQLDMVLSGAGLRGKLRIKTGDSIFILPFETDADVLPALQIDRIGAAFTITPLLMSYRRGIAELITNYGLEVNG